MSIDLLYDRPRIHIFVHSHLMLVILCGGLRIALNRRLFLTRMVRFLAQTFLNVANEI